MADVNTIARYIYQRAPQYGIDPNLAVGIARYEGLNPNTLGSSTFGNRDARGYSFGPFQLYSGSPDPTKIAPGGMAYEFVRRYGQAPSRENWQQQVDFSLETMRDSGVGPWYAVRDQGGVDAITRKGAAFANTAGLLNQAPEAAQPQVRNALIALGTNDYANPQAAAEATQRAIEAARSRGLNPVIVPPNSENDRFRAVSEAVRQAAEKAGVTIAAGTYDPKDPLHLTMESARQLGQQYPGAIPIGDSNAVRIGMGLGYRPTANGSQIYNQQGQLLAQTGLGSSAIAQNIMGLPQPQMPQPTQEGGLFGLPTNQQAQVAAPQVQPPAPVATPAPAPTPTQPPVYATDFGTAAQRLGSLLGITEAPAPLEGAEADAQRQKNLENKRILDAASTAQRAFGSLSLLGAPTQQAVPILPVEEERRRIVQLPYFRGLI
jgi:hypothetical protein